MIDEFVRSGVVVGMCGDGGNDCGALRTAHTGVALSEADASMVSPFTSKQKTPASVVDLLREGRGALHTSIAAYKYLIMYGLLSARTAGSVLGVWLINTAFTVGALFYMSGYSGYVRWPAKFAVGASWWTLGDNWESSVLFFLTYYQFITSGVVFSFSGGFNRTVWRNWFLMLVWGALFALTTFLLLSPPNAVTFTFHIASQAFNRVGTDSPVWMKYQAAGGEPSPGMPYAFRLGLFLIVLGNLVCQGLWQNLVINGRAGRSVARILPSRRPRFNL